MSQTTEKAFEVHVEEMLLQKGGWRPGTNAEWDVECALFPAKVCGFLERAAGLPRSAGVPPARSENDTCPVRPGWPRSI